jgi:hypothetical protein
MFRTLILSIALVAGFGAIGYAQNMRGFQMLSYKAPRMLGGQVNSDGTIAQGSHFTVVHVGTGQYEITLNERFFPMGCPILTLNGISTIAAAHLFLQRCNVYDVEFVGPNNKFVDTEFNLIAVASE